MAEPEKRKITLAKIPLPRENPFRAMTKLFADSIGKLPTPLVIILTVAAVLSVVTGLFLKFDATPRDGDIYLPRRIAAQPEAANLTEQKLRGFWAHQDARNITTLRLGNGVFELITWPKGEKYVRYFIRGGYRSEGNILILQARNDLGSPYNRDHLEIQFLPISLSTLNLYADIQFRDGAGLMSWRIPASEIKRQGSLPFLDAGGEPVVVWTQLQTRP